MNGTPASRTPHIFPTSLDPPESTPQRNHTARPLSCPGWPAARPSGDFRLVQEQNRPRRQTPATDPIDPTLPLNPILDRSLRPGNRSAGISFRHSTWARDREHVHDALAGFTSSDVEWWRPPNDPNAPDLSNFPSPSDRLRRFHECGARSVVLRNVEDPTRYKIACERCHDRFCLPCMQDRARLIVANLRAQLAYEPTRFLTLTLKHTDDPLPDQINHLYTSFTNLRRRQFWQDMVTGGIAFLELKLSKNDLLWHPHLHVLLRGKYVPHKLVSDAWLQITGDSHIVDIRMVRSPDHLYAYLTRYVTKGWDTGIYRTPHALTEAIAALHGRKLLTCFGIFAHLKLLLPPTAETWDNLGTLQEIIVLHLRSVPWATLAYHSLFAADCESDLSGIPPDE